jgi:hypothetical protein
MSKIDIIEMQQYYENGHVNGRSHTRVEGYEKEGKVNMVDVTFIQE